MDNFSGVRSFNDFSSLNVMDIYGHIPDGSEIVLGIGNYNNIHGLLTYFPSDDLLQMRFNSELINPSIVKLILTYEQINNNRLYLSLSLNDRYINVNSNSEACISSEKALFWIDYSTLDFNKTSRVQVLSGVLYSLKSTNDKIVTWKIKGYGNGDLVIFLPTTWYESVEGKCQLNNGIISLVENLQQLKFKGYTTQQWCEEVPKITYCIDNNLCGSCMGPCQNEDTICYVNKMTDDPMFVCGDKDPKLNTVFIENESPSTTGTPATIMAVVIIVLITLLLAWMLLRQ